MFQLSSQVSPNQSSEKLLFIKVFRETSAEEVQRFSSFTNNSTSMLPHETNILLFLAYSLTEEMSLLKLALQPNFTFRCNNSEYVAPKSSVILSTLLELSQVSYFCCIRFRTINCWAVFVQKVLIACHEMC